MIQLAKLKTTSYQTNHLSSNLDYELNVNPSSIIVCDHHLHSNGIFMTKKNKQEYKLKYQMEQKLNDKQKAEKDNAKVCQPIPNKRNNYCGFCQNYFNDYLEHIGTRNHKLQIEQNKYHQEMIDIQQKMEEELNQAYRELDECLLDFMAKLVI